VEIRRAGVGDADDIAALAAELAQSIPFSAESFRVSYPALLADDSACLLLAANGHESVVYGKGVMQCVVYGNGRVGREKKIVVRGHARGRGIGAALMSEFEQWAAARGCALVALATRRAAPFYLALGYEESATYFRKIGPGSEGGLVVGAVSGLR